MCVRELKQCLDSECKYEYLHNGNTDFSVRRVTALFALIEPISTGCMRGGIPPAAVIAHLTWSTSVDKIESKATSYSN